jgi:hypothetical protein
MPVENKSIIDIEDSLAILDTTYYDIGDTLYSYTDGLDSIFIINDSLYAAADTIAGKTRHIPALQYASTQSSLKTLPAANAYTISVAFGGLTKTINQTLFGVNLSGMFDGGSLPEGDATAEQWGYLSDMLPEIVRIPTGANSKFTHPMADKGWGYDLAEIVHYYDATDDLMDAPPLDSVIAHLLEDAFLNGWISSSYIGQFKSLAQKWQAQELLAPGDRYIDQVLQLIKQTEEAHPGHTVQVIVCLNIVSEPADTCKKMIQYLKSNPIHNVTVAGVEMGNETNDRFYEDIMGFSGFEDYYNYINGDNIAPIEDSIFAGTPMQGHHDYINTFKRGQHFTAKVGLVASGLDPNKYVFINGDNVDHDMDVDAWNEALVAHYTDTVHAVGGAVRKVFDANILHLYDDGKNWDEIVFNNLDSNYACIDTATGKWSFSSYDARLKPAYDSLRLNFKNFLTPNNGGYEQAFAKYDSILKFGLSLANGGKELWVTETNIKVSNNSYGPNERKLAAVFANSYLHTFILQEWWLRNVKENYARNVRNGYFTINTIQNYAGGTPIDMLNPADSADLKDIGKFYPPYSLAKDDTDFMNYYVRRSTYYTMRLISEITAKDLKYMPCNFSYSARNINMQPTVFIDPAKQNIYMYFSNGRDSSQNYGINTTGLTGAGHTFPTATGVHLDTAMIYYVQGLQLYSTSGSSSLFDINACYNSTDVLHPFEIRQIDTLKNNHPACTGGTNPLKCFTVPPYSTGYIKIPITPVYRTAEAAFAEQDITLYPNPASSVILIAAPDDANICSLRIFNTAGKLFLAQTVTAYSAIDVSALPPGFYEAELQTTQHQSFYKPLIIIK